MAKHETINIRLSTEEKEVAQKLAQSEGLTISAYIRRMILITSRAGTRKQRAA